MGVPLEIRRSDRARRLRLEVRPGGIRVVVPARCSARAVDAFLASQQAWIEAKTAVWRSFAHPGEGPVNPVLPQLGGERMIVFRGRRTRLMLADTSAHRPRISWKPETGITLELPLRWAHDRREPLGWRALSRWYDGILEGEATQIVTASGVPNGLTPTAIRFSQPRMRWGSCAGNGTIRLNRRLIGAPAPVFRSVVLHELAHLKHRNHGAGFWALVAALDPAWSTSRDWLRRYGVTLG